MKQQQSVTASPIPVVSFSNGSKYLLWMGKALGLILQCWKRGWILSFWKIPPPQSFFSPKLLFAHLGKCTSTLMVYFPSNGTNNSLGCCMVFIGKIILKKGFTLLISLPRPPGQNSLSCLVRPPPRSVKWAANAAAEGVVLHVQTV